MSVRDYQKRTPQWTIGKNFDGTGGFGPVLVTADELPPGAAGLQDPGPPQRRGDAGREHQRHDLGRGRDHRAADRVPDAGARRRDRDGHAGRRRPGAHAAGVDEGRRHASRSRSSASARWSNPIVDERLSMTPGNARRLRRRGGRLRPVGRGRGRPARAGTGLRVVRRATARARSTTSRARSRSTTRSCACSSSSAWWKRSRRICEPFTPSEYFGVDGQLIKPHDDGRAALSAGLHAVDGVHPAAGRSRAARACRRRCRT